MLDFAAGILAMVEDADYGHFGLRGLMIENHVLFHPHGAATGEEIVPYPSQPWKLA
jgi:hypothetical protein